MAPLIPVSMALKSMQGGSKEISKVLTGDIAVLRGTTKPRGKGRGKHGGGLDYELHVNPVGIGLGAAAIGGAALLCGVALYAAGLGASREQGVSKTRTIRMISKGAATQETVYTGGTTPYQQADVYKTPRYAVYNERNVPIRYIDGVPTSASVLSPSDAARGWTVTSFERRDDYYVATVANSEKKRFALGSRPRGGLISIGGGSLI
jgi:hypothetical protein